MTDIIKEVIVTLIPFRVYRSQHLSLLKSIVAPKNQIIAQTIVVKDIFRGNTKYLKTL